MISKVDVNSGRLVQAEKPGLVHLDYLLEYQWLDEAVKIQIYLQGSHFLELDVVVPHVDGTRMPRDSAQTGLHPINDSKFGIIDLKGIS